MAGGAHHPRRAVPIGPAHHQRQVRLHALGLGRAVASGMTVHAARMRDHLAGLLEQRDRASAIISDHGESGHRPERVRSDDGRQSLLPLGVLEHRQHRARDAEGERGRGRAAPSSAHHVPPRTPMAQPSNARAASWMAARMRT
jgi:hypothetical protein